MKKKFFYVMGVFFLCLAFVGAFLPLLPTTPFALLSAFFFSKSSPKVYQWCLSLPLIGPGIKDWEHHKMIRPRAKVSSVLCILLGLIFLWWKPYGYLLLKIIVSCILFTVILFILTRKSSSSLERS